MLQFGNEEQRRLKKKYEKSRGWKGIAARWDRNKIWTIEEEEPLYYVKKTPYRGARKRLKNTPIECSEEKTLII